MSVSVNFALEYQAGIHLVKWLRNYESLNFGTLDVKFLCNCYNVIWGAKSKLNLHSKRNRYKFIFIHILLFAFFLICAGFLECFNCEICVFSVSHMGRTSGILFFDVQLCLKFTFFSYQVEIYPIWLL